MSLVITDSTTTDTKPVVLHTRGAAGHSCACGQQLDVCAREHCPRCGRTLHAA
jgi:hypothetical protein